MTPEELYEKYPHLFARRHLDKSQTCMCWGIAVNDGWLPIIDRLSDSLSKDFPYVQYEQIKEKFGALRIYTHGLKEEDAEDVRFLIAKATAESLQTCEICGSTGALRGGGWRRVLCDEHNKENQPALDTRIRWYPENDRHGNGILIENLTDGHLANAIRYIREKIQNYGKYQLSLFEEEATRRGLTAEFLNREHPVDEYKLVDDELVPSK